MNLGLKMNSFKTLVLVDIIALIMLLVFPIQSMPTNDDFASLPIQHKRWTFNTWRLHGRRQLSDDFYSSKTSLSPFLDDHQYQIFTDEEYEAPKTDANVSELLRE
ncbi:unnamed protein product [Rotaria socialis]|uniref:Uncharacterized protein n=1 Tax=Rotaria socialis TaxID=392032 RepID=A0A818LJL0_9BILA|nr:unnamed protein product [Rotaria socialis]CAF3439733.1 unnamed protein product [Rotaria socialis]CAF3573176.1 unnamed protein product [Rotaria socialis]CAF3608043.1 unnamed protein product [Rotaria socialis]CAF3747333.1 unnamed protein product [Rotaria socialis]